MASICLYDTQHMIESARVMVGDVLFTRKGLFVVRDIAHDESGSLLEGDVHEIGGEHAYVGTLLLTVKGWSCVVGDTMARDKAGVCEGVKNPPVYRNADSFVTEADEERARQRARRDRELMERRWREGFTITHTPKEIDGMWHDLHRRTSLSVLRDRQLRWWMGELPEGVGATGERIERKSISRFRLLEMEADAFIEQGERAKRRKLREQALQAMQVA